jgi:LPXTG-site transpeptidase (sortase) family protein
MKRSGGPCCQLGQFGLVLFAAGAALAAQPVAHEILGKVSAAQAKAIWRKWKQNADHRSEHSRPGQPDLWLRIPSCNLSNLILAESNAEALHRFPAARHLPSGAVVIFAHRDTHFRPLSHLQPNDQIDIEDGDGTWSHYFVESMQVILPEQINAVLDTAAGDELYLLTCYPFRYIGPAPQRFLVKAKKLAE